MVVDINSISWKRGEDWILRDVSWHIRRGEHWSLVGLNGSGKTTLLNMICGYLWPTSGSVSVLGETFGRCDLRELRKRIGWVSNSLQEKLHQENTAKEIVLSGRFASIGLYDHITPEDEARAEGFLRLMRCEALMDRAYQTFSQGERQRILIARALMASPELLILDEPCTGLDLLAREQLLEMIDKIAQDPHGPTLIYVTHHVEEILPCFTHTLMLKKGEVFHSGPTPSALTTEQLTDFFETPIALKQQDERVWLSLV
ncbi:putative ABC transporter ATP-binding protein YlmA [Pullulanibacillus camelliae]|uniref:Putative ABC transporter ATP-binding protein YlmA n=1 Tax=Pullulanibacillus camelliae TaxID=1707096 RepID=A0A8J3E0Z2_9BACL|nr:ABC transporter ATP-binding protein [Pullulanibacillus camelliae]GGE55424.1 putative ABC transporter ATP-binding protein YlmA [Pullulanibacillus camelliae]